MKSTHPFSPLLAATSLLALIPALATAQPLPGSDSLRTIDAPGVVVEALRTPAAADSVPFAISTVTPAPGRKGLSLDEALTAIPGVQVDDRYNFAVGDRISIRGFGARTQFGVRGIRIVTDGIPATFADGQSTLDAVDPAAIDHAEVLRGPAASLYGNAAGGVIVIRSAPPSPFPLAISAETSAGSDGLLRNALDAGGTSGDAAWTARLSRLRYDGFREHSAATAYRGTGTFHYSLGERDRLRVDASYADLTSENPGAITDSVAAIDPRAAAAANVTGRTGKNGTQEGIGIGWSHDLDLGGVDVEIYGIRRDVDNPITTRIIELGRTAGGARALVHGSASPFGLVAGWAAGADLDLQIDERQNYINSGGERGDRVLDQHETVVGGAGFLQGTLSIADAVTVMAGARYDRTGFRAEDKMIGPSDPDDSGELSMGALSPSAGALWRITDRLQIYANVATSFDTPTTTELANRPDGAGGFNPELQPQHALSLEAGLRGSPLRWLSFELTAFRTRVTDALIPYQVPGSADRDFYRNAGTAIHRGVEMALNLSPVPGLTARLGGGYIDARYDSYTVDGNAFGGNRIPGVAPVRAELSLSYLSSPGWYLALDGRSVARMMVNDANSASAPPYTLFNARGGHLHLTLGDGAWRWELAPYAGIDNILDRRYHASVTINAFGGRFFEPGPGRTFYAGVAVNIGRRE
jgi:iron complex outermembrane receptor protein